MNERKSKALKGSEEFSPEDSSNFLPIQELMEEILKRNFAFHRDHCQMRAVNEYVIKKELRQVAIDLRSILDYLCTILSSNSKVDATRDSFKGSFPVFYGNHENLEILFETFKKKWSKKVFSKDCSKLTKEESDVLKIIFKVQPLTQFLNGSATVSQDHPLKPHAFEAYLFYTMNLFRNDVTHQDFPKVEAKEVDGLTLHYVEQNGQLTHETIDNKVMFVFLPNTAAGKYPEMQIIPSVVPLWIKLVTKIVSSCLNCVSQTLGKNGDHILGETMVSWNDDYLIVGGDKVTWAEYSKVRFLGKGKYKYKANSN